MQRNRQICDLNNARDLVSVIVFSNMSPQQISIGYLINSLSPDRGFWNWRNGTETENRVFYILLQLTPLFWIFCVYFCTLHFQIFHKCIRKNLDQWFFRCSAKLWQPNFFLLLSHDSAQLKSNKFIFFLFHQIYKPYILKYIKNGKFLSLFIIYFKIQNLNIFNNIFSKIYLLLHGVFLFVFLIINFRVPQIFHIIKSGPCLQKD